MNFPTGILNNYGPNSICMYDSLLCRKLKTPTLAETKHLIIVPQSFQKQFLSIAHEASGHQGSDRTILILSDSAYWVGMARDVNNHCSQCYKCQICKAPASKPIPLQPVVTTRPWEMVAVDVLEVPPSLSGNQYTLPSGFCFCHARSESNQNCTRIMCLPW